MNKMTRGFTIVELVIVIVIIGILAAIGIASYNRIQMESRDSQREAAIITIANALEKYYEENGDYPFRTALNPTGTKTQLPNYDAVRALLPSLTDEILSTGGYNFMPLGCGITCGGDTDSSGAITPPKTVALATPAAAANIFAATSTIPYERRLTQFIYFASSTTTTSYLQYSSSNNMWGCRLETTLAKPGFVLAWRSEATGKWNFTRSKYGNVTIANAFTGPVAPTVCAFR